MYRRSDPRFRRTLNEISQTIESANESAQANIFTFAHNYLSPCFHSVSSWFEGCTAHCFPNRNDRKRRSRARSYGRAELNFDFYDDWDDDETDGLLGWGNDEFDSLLGQPGGYGGTNGQPGRQRGMSYGTRREGRRKSTVQPDEDPTIIPGSSYFGFLGKLTGKLGKKALRYKPSAADLQEHPGATRKAVPEGEPLIEESEEDGVGGRKAHRRNRSGTAGSGGTTDSLSSRGDIFPSEDELDDAVPLDDEFAMVLERRTTNSQHDESSSGRRKRPSAGSRLSTRTMSSRSMRSSKRTSTTGSPAPERTLDEDANPVPSLTELKWEEEQARQQEEIDLAKRREAAQRLALERGLHSEPTTPRLSVSSVVNSPQTHSPIGQGPPATREDRRRSVIPFPAFDPPPEEEDEEGYFDQTQRSEQPGLQQDDQQTEQQPAFVPAQLPHFSSQEQ